MDHLILARHGESTYSARGLCSGDPNVEVPLTPRGRAQAGRLGVELAGETIGLVVTSEFGRTQETADVAFAGRSIPRLVLPELNDVDYGEFEGRPLAEYRAWLHEREAAAELPTGESRANVAARCCSALRFLLGREEGTIVAVTHELIIAFALTASRGETPAAPEGMVEYATPYRLSRQETEEAMAMLQRWLRAPR